MATAAPPYTSGEQSAPGWMIVGKDPRLAGDPRVQALFDEASRAVPPGFLNESVPEMLPRRPVMDRCRICGRTAQLTKEHIPPKASGNVRTGWAQSFQDYLNRDDWADWGGGRHQQGGIFGCTLCADCNSYTGRHYGGAEYRRWALAAEQALSTLPHPLALDQLNWPSLGCKLEGGDLESPVHPGSLVRQALSFFCSLSGSWDLASQHPEIRRIILGQSQEPLAAPLQIGMNLYLGPHVRMVGPTLMVSLERGEWQWLMEMAFAPFSFLCVLTANNDNYDVGSVMTDWTQYAPSKMMHFETPIRIGFGWTPYPGDYRSRAQIRAGRQRLHVDPDPAG